MARACIHKFEKYCELFAFPVPGIKRCANSLFYIKNVEVSNRTREPSFKPFRSAQPPRSALRVLLVSLDCPMLTAFIGDLPIYETSVETPLGCGIDIYLPHWSLRGPDFRGHTQERVQKSTKYSATPRLVALDEWEHHERRHQTRS